MGALSRATSALALVAIYVFGLPAAHAGASCLLFPLSCLKPTNKYGDEQEALVLDISTTKIEHIESDEFGNWNRKGTSALNDSRNVYVEFRVGHTTYIGLHQDTNMFTAALGYLPKREEWVGRTFKMKFMDQDWIGLKGSGAIFTRPDGKEYKMVLMHIFGPDGKDQCGIKVETCPPQAGVEREKLEAEQLEKVAKAGGRRYDLIKPAPVELPPAPEAAAAGAAATGAAAPEAAAAGAVASGAVAAGAATPGEAATAPPAPAAGEPPVASAPPAEAPASSMPASSSAAPAPAPAPQP